jgi:hypothetical protein
MFKHLFIAAVLIAVAGGAAEAQHREATLQKVDLPGASYDIVVATAKPGGWAFNPLNHDAYLGGIVHLGDSLVHLLTEDFLKTFSSFSVLPHPACTFQSATKNGAQPTPVVIYLVPKTE